MTEAFFRESSSLMGQMIGARNWNDHPLGPIENWPSALTIALANMLSSKFAKFIFWGEELYCFYNDGFLSSLEDRKYQNILGEPAEKAIPVMWPMLSQHKDAILKQGEALWFENMIIPIMKDGEIKASYFTLSPSPLYDSNGSICGILVTMQETTRSVTTIQEAIAGQEKLYDLLKHAPLGIALLEGDDLVFTFANRQYFETFDRTDLELIGKSFLDSFPENREQMLPIFEHVLKSGEPYSGYELLMPVKRKGGLVDMFFNFSYSPVKDKDGKVVAVLATISDVSEIARSRQIFRDSEERLRLSTENNAIATWDLNLKEKSIKHGDYLSEIFGEPKDKKMTFEELRSYLLDEDRKNIVEPAFAEAMKTGLYNYEARLITADNELRWIRTHGKVYFDDNQEPVRMVGIMQNITEAKTHQLKLEASEERYRNLADFVPQFIWVADAKGNLYYFNKATLEYTGYSMEELLNEPGWIGVVHPEDREYNLQVWAHSIETKQPFTFEHRFKSSDGSYKWQLSRAIPIMDDQNEVEYWLGTSTDIDAIKRDEQQRNDFIKMANHELKTPVSTIKGYVQLLLKMLPEETDPMLTSSLKTINNQVNKLTALIGDLLDITKIEIGSLPLHIERKDLVEEVKRSIEDIQATNPNHEFNFDKNGIEEIFVNLDTERFSQVMMNLFTNAVKYSPTNNKVNISLEKQDGGVVISVQDFGIGIDKAEAKKIFEQFYRVSGKDEKTYPGFGIGLFIVQEILIKLNGKIWVESEKGKGSTFKVWLPLASPIQDS